MKTEIRNLKMGVLLTGLAMLSSCNNHAAIESAENIHFVSQTIPAVTMTIVKYSEHKIVEYFNSSSIMEKKSRTTSKKAEKTGSSQKAKSISIGISREARLV